MARIKLVQLLLICGFAISIAVKPSAGQNLPAPSVPDQNLGINLNQVYEGQHEDVNLATGNLSLDLRPVKLPGRQGHDLDISFSYNSQIWRLVPNVQTVNMNGTTGTITFWQWSRTSDQALQNGTGWFGFGQFPAVLRDLNVQMYTGQDSQGHPAHQFCDSNFRLIMPDGSTHHFPGIYQNCYLDEPGAFSPPYSNTPVGDTDVQDPLWMRYDVNAGLFAPGGDRWVIPGYEDANGNIISTANSVSGSNGTTSYTDTVGRSVQLPYQVVPGPNFPNSVLYKDSNGTTQTITLNYASAGSFTTQGSFANPPPVASSGQPGTYAMAAMNCSASNPCPWPQMLTSIVLPNGLTYTFHYNNTFGELDQITYPSGGYTRYEYATFQHSGGDPQAETPSAPWDYREIVAKHVCRAPVVPAGTLTYTALGVAAANTCPVAEDTTTYAPTINSNNVYNASTTVTDPLGNVTVVTFCPPPSGNPCGWAPYETKRQIYDNANHLLRTIDTAYGAFPYKSSETTTLANGLVTKTELDYQTATRLYSVPGSGFPATSTTAPTGNVVEKREFDYGQGAPGPLLRRTDTAWAYATPTAPFNNRKTSDVIYGGSGNVVAQTTFEYDNYTQGLAASGATQHDSAFGTSYGTRGNTTAINRWRNTDGAWLTTRNQFDDAGNVLGTTDPGNHTTSFSYADSWGNNACLPTGGNAAAYLTQVSNALGQTTKYKYNSCSGSVASSTDANSQTTSFTYDAMDRAVQASYPDGGQSMLNYNGDPVPSHVTKTVVATPNPNIVSDVFYDGLGRVTRSQLTSDPEGADYTDTGYDALGRLLTVSNPYRATSDPTFGITCNGTINNGLCVSGYDALGRLTVVTEQDGNTVRTDYSSFPTVTITDETGRQRQSVTDALGRLTTVVEPNPTTGSVSTGAYYTYYTYDVLGNLTNVNQQGDGSQAARNRSFTYDSLSRLLDATNPETGRICYGTVSGTTCNRDGYDADGNLLYRTDARGLRTTYSGYDGLHRLGSKSYSDATPVVAYFYDQSSYNGLTIVNGIGRRTGMSDGSGQTAWSYDAMGRAKNQRQTIAGATHSIGYNYDLAGSLSSIVYPSGRTVQYSTSAAGRVLSIVDAANISYNNYVTNAHYAPPGEVTSATHGWGITESNTFNNRLQPSVLSVSSSSQTLLSLSYAYDQGAGTNNGDIMQLANNRDGSNNRSLQYSYDALNRLKTAGTITGASTPWSSAYSYDPWGNLLQKSTAGPGDPSVGPLTVDSTNRVNGPGGGYTYDAAGNLIFDGINALLFDGENRMSPNSGGQTVYTYDGDGHRVETSIGSTTTLYWYDVSSHPISVGDRTGSIGRDYIYFNGKRIGFTSLSSGNTHYYYDNHLGSSSVISNGDGTSIEWEADYYPFGTKHVLNNYLDTFFLFTGYEFDYETGYYYAGARHDSPTLGRFMSPDPAGMMAVNLEFPQSLNRYAYVNNNPLSFIDPVGLDCVYLNNAGTAIEKGGVDQHSSSGECGKTGGYWVDGSVTQENINADKGTVELWGTNNGTDVTHSRWQDATIQVGMYQNSLFNPAGHIAFGINNGPRFGLNPASDFGFMKYAIGRRLQGKSGGGPGVPGKVKIQGGAQVRGAIIPVTGMQVGTIIEGIANGLMGAPNYDAGGGQLTCDCASWSQQVLGDAGINTGPRTEDPGTLIDQIDNLYPQPH